MNWMYINDDGDWTCQYCCTSALMFESVLHFPDCPVILAEKPANTVLQSDSGYAPPKEVDSIEDDLPF
jgi:hypothetical protein